MVDNHPPPAAGMPFLPVSMPLLGLIRTGRDPFRQNVHFGAYSGPADFPDFPAFPALGNETGSSSTDTLESPIESDIIE